MLKEGVASAVSYHKTKMLNKQEWTGEYTLRVIIPTYVPQPKHQNIKAIDVTDLSEEDRERMINLWNEYQEYLEAQRRTLFNFEDFMNHTGVELLDVKWRTFKPDGLQETR